MDSIDLGCAPWNEDCASVGQEGFAMRAQRECRALIAQFRRACGDPPAGVRFRVVSNPHDFGTYYSVVVEYDGDDAEGAAYAQRCDDENPDVWDMEARLELDAARRRGAA